MGESSGRGVANALLGGIAGLFGADPTEIATEPGPIRGTKLQDAPGRPKTSGKDEFDLTAVSEGVCALLALPGLLGELQDGFARDHWIKAPDQVKPMSVPLTRYLNRLKPAQIKLLLNYMDPFLFLCGTAAVVGPCVRMEIAFRDEVRAFLYEQSTRSHLRYPDAGRAGPSYPVDTASDAAASAGDNGAAAPEGGHPPRGRLDRVNLARTDGGFLDTPPRTG